MMTLTGCESCVEVANHDNDLRLSQYEKDAVTNTMYALLCMANGDYVDAALYLAKAEIARRA